MCVYVWRVAVVTYKQCIDPVAWTCRGKQAACDVQDEDTINSKAACVCIHTWVVCRTHSFAHAITKGGRASWSHGGDDGFEENKQTRVTSASDLFHWSDTALNQWHIQDTICTNTISSCSSVIIIIINRAVRRIIKKKQLNVNTFKDTSKTDNKIIKTKRKH